MGFCLLSSRAVDIISRNFHHFSHNFVRIHEFFFFLNFLGSFFQFSYQEDKFLISSKTPNILKWNTCSKSALRSFPKNLNALKVNNNKNIQWKNIIIVFSEIPFSKNSYRTEASQLIWKALQLIGFYMIRVFSKRCFRIDFKTALAFTT